MAKEYSRVAVWRALDSEHGDRLQEIMREHLLLVRESYTYQGDKSEILSRIDALRSERDAILSLFEDKPDPDHDEEEKRVGRPSLGVTKKVSVTLPEEAWDAVDAVVDFFGGSKSSVIRDAVSLYTERFQLPVNQQQSKDDLNDLIELNKQEMARVVALLDDLFKRRDAGTISFEDFRKQVEPLNDEMHALSRNSTL